MSDGKPVEVMRGAFGGWYAVSQFKDMGAGRKLAQRRNPISNAAELEKLYESHGFLGALLKATGKTMDDLADDYGLEIKPRAAS